jgi:uncharacterized protein
LDDGLWAKHIGYGLMATTKPRTFASTLAVAIAGAMLAAPAGAQFSSGRSEFVERPRAEFAQFRDFLPFFGERGTSGQSSPYNPLYPQRQPQVYESIRAPAPRKLETPPASTVVVIGDSLADWLGYGLEQAFADSPEIGIVRKIKLYSGLVRYEAARGEIQEWSQAIRDLLATEKPSAIVLMLGTNDRLPLRAPLPPPPKGAAAPGKGAAPPPQAQPATPPAPASSDTESDAAHEPVVETSEPRHRLVPGAWYQFHSDEWAELYSKRIDSMIAALKSKGVPVLWVGLPAVRGATLTSDMSYLDEFYRARAQKAGITYVDIWDAFVDEKGQFAMQGPDFEGQTRRLRTYDGINFTKPGAEKLGHLVERELHRVLTNRAVPVALPGPEEPAKEPGARPAIGPIVPLSAAATGGGGDLLGASGHPGSATNDPVATRVLSHGDAIAAPTGRADDFSWPRANANDATDAIPAPVVATPPTPQAKGANKGETNKSEMKRPGDGKTASSNVMRLHRPHAAHGASSRPPLAVAPTRD